MINKEIEKYSRKKKDIKEKLKKLELKPYYHELRKAYMEQHTMCKNIIQTLKRIQDETNNISDNNIDHNF